MGITKVIVKQNAKDVTKIVTVGPAMIITRIGPITINQNQNNGNGSSEVFTRDIVNPAVAYASLNNVLPSSPVDKQRHSIFFGGLIAIGEIVVDAFSVSAISPDDIYQSLTPVQALGGDVLIYEYELATKLWRRVQ
jgi:hypothetical protein